LRYCTGVQPVFCGAKEVLRLRGVEIGDVRAPFLSLGETEKTVVRKVYEQIQKLLEIY